MITPEQKRRMVREDERYFLHNQFLRIGLAIIVLVPLAWITFGLVSHSLTQRKVEGALQAAQAAIAAGSPADALTHLDAALAADPMSAAVLEMAGDLARDYRPLEYLRLRMRFDKSSPDSTTAKLKLARAAIESGAFSVAEEALARVPTIDKMGADYLATEAALLRQQGNLEGAINLLQRCIETANDPIPYMLDFAAVLLESKKPEAAGYLGQLYQIIAKSSPHHTTFLRILRDDFLARQLADEAVVPAIAIIDSGKSTASDRVLAMEALNKSSAAPAAERMAAIFKHAQDDAEIHRLGLRLLASESTSLVSDVLEQLPAAFRNSSHAKALSAACYAKDGVWASLIALLEEAPWPGLHYLHSAYMAQALRATHADGVWKARWSEAMRHAATSPESLDLLYLTVSSWPGWHDETTRALWKFVESGNQVTEALKRLDEHYRSLRDDGGLLRVVSSKLERAPDDLALRIEYARLCLLRRVRIEEAGRIAAESFAAEPNLPDAILTHAFALTTVGKHEEAIDIMQSLPSHMLQQSRPAAYMAIILAAAGRAGESAKFLDFVKSDTLLTAERALLPKSR